MEKKYCAAPWRSLHINFSGDVKTCCAGDPNLLGNIQDQTINEILSGPVLKEIKASIKQGVLHPKYCYNCIRSERYGNSERNWHNMLNEEFEVATANLDEHIPTLLDIRWNNTCNLACNYCMPYCSTRWASIMKQKFNEDIKPYYQEVIDYIDLNKNSLREVALVGGEPLLMKENIDLLDVLSRNILVTLITNLSVNFEKNAIVQKLLDRTRVGWSMSFENLGEQFEYVRYGSTWEMMDKNVTVVADKIKNTEHHGGIHAVYNLYNCTRLCDLKEYAESKQLNIHWQTLHQPDVLDPLKHNSRVRDLALNEIYSLKNKFNLHKHELPFIDSVLSALENNIASDADISDEFRQFTNTMETKYHPTSKQFADLWPELHKVI